MTDEHPCCPDAHKIETPTLFGTSLLLLLACVIFCQFTVRNCCLVTRGIIVCRWMDSVICFYCSSFDKAHAGGCTLSFVQEDPHGPGSPEATAGRTGFCAAKLYKTLLSTAIKRVINLLHTPVIRMLDWITMLASFSWACSPLGNVTRLGGGGFSGKRSQDWVRNSFVNEHKHT